MTSELTTNAVTHGGKDKPVTLWLEIDDDGLFIGVVDTAAEAPKRTGTDCDAENGRGLEIVEALSLEWGYRRLSRGRKCVYATLEMPHD